LGASKKKEFEYLKERVWRKIQGWMEKLLSKAGKEILIKAIAQAIPTYAMSCFDLTKSLCEEISSLICRYWWNQQEDTNKCHWIGWDRMTRSKADGGLGFRDLHVFNLAMLARQGWRLLQDPSSLCATILKAKYFPNSVLEAQPQNGMSYTWRSILRGIELLKQGVVWRVGTGELINVWSDPWVPRGTTRRPVNLQGHALVEKVVDLINPITEQWDAELVLDLFGEEDAKHILEIPLRSGIEDQLAWHYDLKGMFSVKTAYHLGVSIRDTQQGRDASSSSLVASPNSPWKQIWKLKLPAKIKLFLWRLAHNSLPTRMNIHRKHIDLDTRCPVCLRMNEDGGHLFLRCKEVKKVWRLLNLEGLRVALLECDNPCTLFELLWKKLTQQQELVSILLYVWWNARNRINAGDRAWSSEEVCAQINKHLHEYVRKIDSQSSSRKMGASCFRSLLR
jgi:hypothetical protein